MSVDTTLAMVSMPAVIGGIGNGCELVIQNGGKEIVLPGNLREIIGLNGIKQLAEKYCKFDGKPGSVVFHEGKYIVYEPKEGLSAPTSGAVEKTKKATITRPPNAFILYRQMKHGQVKEQSPDLRNTEISTIIGRAWRNEPPDVRQFFFDLADQVKNQHALEHPGYTYKPRRSSDKKRRMSRKKAEKLSRLLAVAHSDQSSSPGEAHPTALGSDTDSTMNVPDTHLHKGLNKIVLGADFVDGRHLAAALQQHNASVGTAAAPHSSTSGNTLAATIVGSTYNTIDTFTQGVMSSPAVHNNLAGVKTAMEQLMEYKDCGVPNIPKFNEKKHLPVAEVWREFIDFTMS